jgi:hypothetical protein
MSLSRTIKPIAFFICSQHWNDLDVYLRRRVDYYVPVVRYITSEGKPTRPLAKPFHVAHYLTDLVISPVYVYYKPFRQLHRLYAMTFDLPSPGLVREFEKKEKARKSKLIEADLDMEE